MYLKRTVPLLYAGFFSPPVVLCCVHVALWALLDGGQVVFEEFGFAACYRCPSAALSCYHEQMLEEERENA